MTDNAFLRAVSQSTFLTENGAITHGTTGSALLDYFSKAGTYRGRKQGTVDAVLTKLWKESPQLTLMMVFYLRMVTRRGHGFVATTEVQKGQGSRDEFRRSLSWLARRQPESLTKNLWLVPEVGRWSDLWHEEVVDVMPRQAVFELVQRGLEHERHRPLIAKYLPRARSRGKRFTARHDSLQRWVRDFCQHMGWTAKTYRRFKSAPEHGAHQFQRDMCAGRWDALRFGAIPGRAMFQLGAHVDPKDGKTTLERHGQLERFVAWLERQETVPFTGYPYELYQAANRSRLGLGPRMMLDRQFDGLVALAKEDRGGMAENVWCALDTSGSMGALAAPGVSAIDICLGLGLYFSALNEGAFRDHVVMFDSTSRVVQLRGTFTERVEALRKEQVAWGSTNFQSVVDLICQVRRGRPEVPLGDFPTTLLVVSDMQFNPVGDNTETNYQAAMRKLAAVGLPPIKIVWWWVTGRGEDFPSTIADRGVTLVGGFDGSVLELLVGGDDAAAPGPLPEPPDPYQQMVRALDQELLRELQP